LSKNERKSQQRSVTDGKRAMQDKSRDYPVFLRWHCIAALAAPPAQRRRLAHSCCVDGWPQSVTWSSSQRYINHRATPNEDAFGRREARDIDTCQTRWYTAINSELCRL